MHKDTLRYWRLNAKRKVGCSPTTCMPWCNFLSLSYRFYLSRFSATGWRSSFLLLNIDSIDDIPPIECNTASMHDCATPLERKRHCRFGLVNSAEIASRMLELTIYIEIAHLYPKSERNTFEAPTMPNTKEYSPLMDEDDYLRLSPKHSSNKKTLLVVLLLGVPLIFSTCLNLFLLLKGLNIENSSKSGSKWGLFTTPFHTYPF